MNILYCGDSKITDGLIISVLSILKYEKGTLHIYILSMNYLDKLIIEDKVIKVLDNLVKDTNKNSFVKLIDVEYLFNKELPYANLKTNFTVYCMLRLYADLVDLPEKILYLDNDVVACSSFRKFYDTDITNYLVAGVRDFYGKYFYSKNKIKRDYLNSGVLLLNLKLIRSKNTFKKCRKLCAKRKMLLPDQSALNKYCKPKLILKRKYNEQHALKKDTVFRHFTTTFKFIPYFRLQKVKPWDVERMHEVLKYHEFDDILNNYKKIKEKL